MKPKIVKILFFFFLFVSHCGYVSATESQDERKKRHAVSRLYEITESMVQLCSHAPSALAYEYKSEVSRFIEAFPKLMTLVKLSPHYEYAQRTYSYERSKDPETEEMRIGGCEVVSKFIGAMIDTPQGRSEVEKFEKLLAQ